MGRSGYGLGPDKLLCRLRQDRLNLVARVDQRPNDLK